MLFDAIYYILFTTMIWTVTSQHKDFFQENHYILFEDLINDELYLTLRQTLKDTLRQKGSKALIAHGKDIAVDHPVLKKFLFNKAWAKIFAELMMQKKIRFGFDQALFFSSTASITSTFEANMPITETASIQGILGGVIFGLSQCENDSLPICKSALFFDKYYTLPYTLLKKQEDSLYLMIVYTAENSVYIHNPKDPSNEYFRIHGYHFGDKLQDKDFPILYNASAFLG